MKILRCHGIVFCLLLLAPPAIRSQALDLPPILLEKLEAMEAELLLPLDSDYRVIPGREDDFQPCDFAIRSRKEGMEMRFLLLPTDYPHVLAVRTATPVATNDPQAPIALLTLGAEELLLFHADWGVEYVFTPKPGFSEHRFGKLMVLHKEGRGAVMVFFLFDEADNPAIDMRYQCVEFKDYK